MNSNVVTLFWEKLAKASIKTLNNSCSIIYFSAVVCSNHAVFPSLSFEASSHQIFIWTILKYFREISKSTEPSTVLSQQWVNYCLSISECSQLQHSVWQGLPFYSRFRLNQKLKWSLQVCAAVWECRSICKGKLTSLYSLMIGLFSLARLEWPPQCDIRFCFLKFPPQCCFIYLFVSEAPCSLHCFSLNRLPASKLMRNFVFSPHLTLTFLLWSLKSSGSQVLCKVMHRWMTAPLIIWARSIHQCSGGAKSESCSRNVEPCSTVTEKQHHPLRRYSRQPNSHPFWVDYFVILNAIFMLWTWQSSKLSIKLKSCFFKEKKFFLLML